MCGDPARQPSCEHCLSCHSFLSRSGCAAGPIEGKRLQRPAPPVRVLRVQVRSCSIQQKWNHLKASDSFSLKTHMPEAPSLQCSLLSCPTAELVREMKQFSSSSVLALSSYLGLCSFLFCNFRVEAEQGHELLIILQASGSCEGTAGRKQCFSNRVTGYTREGSTVVIVILWMLILMGFSDIKDILDHLGDSFIDKHYCRHQSVYTWVSRECFQLYLGE